MGLASTTVRSNPKSNPKSLIPKPFRTRQGWHGWDDYAPFYDWENARTVGRRDVAFWCDLARGRGGPVLELGCGTGRILAPLARHAATLAGVDRSDPMLARARRRLRRTPRPV